MKPGWIRIWRKIKTNPLWEADKPFSRMLAWIDLLIRAAYEDEEVWFMGNTIRLARGELVSSLRILAKEWGWSKNKVDRFLNQLVELKMVEKRDSSLLKVFIVNYGKYQPLEEAGGTRKGQRRDTRNNSEERKKLITLHRAERAGEPLKNNEPSANAHGEPSKSDEPSPRNPDIKRFIDFFCEACKRIRKEKPVIVKGKDGRLAKLALRAVSESQLEQLAIWHLEKNRHMQATIGAMLAKKSLEILRSDMNRNDFWKEINSSYDRYWPRVDYAKELAKKFQPFSYEQINQIAEEVARQERALK